MAPLHRFWLIILIIVFTVGCNAKVEDASPTIQVDSFEPTIISPDSGLGGITGSVGNAGEFWPGIRITIYAAEYYGATDDEGVFLLEPMLFPKSVLTGDHYFQINNIPPKKYLLLVGPNPESALFVREGGKPLIVDVYADQIINIGQVEVGE